MSNSTFSSRNEWKPPTTHYGMKSLTYNINWVNSNKEGNLINLTNPGSVRSVSTSLGMRATKTGLFGRGISRTWFSSMSTMIFNKDWHSPVP